ncbi:cyclin-A1-1-like [Andrographis paniculata]|uniref:cyclin-A1-1-like n=1 Tax=Andrographis paniculata TaxID=175694 RepID=UPI0021E731E3|nr:cyclin-A1-1-like [Andrographis paniculata]
MAKGTSSLLPSEPVPPPTPILRFDQPATNYVEPYMLTFGAIKTIWSIDNDIFDRSRTMDLPEDTMIFDIDSGEKDPLFCSYLANDIFRNLQSEEDKNRPRADYIENVQKLISHQERVHCIDWLFSAVEGLCLSSDTLHLSIHCLDRFLSGVKVDKKNLFLSGLTCLMIASKFIELKTRFKIEAYADPTNNIFFKEDLIRMEGTILTNLDYNVANSTAKSFLGRYVRAAKAGKSKPLPNLESMACYLADLSLLSYAMLPYKPSMVAASCVFLAQYILCPCKWPWSATLRHYTSYKPSDLTKCVVELHAFCSEIQLTRVPNARIKYSHQMYGGVGSTTIPTLIPYELFKDNYF